MHGLLAKGRAKGRKLVHWMNELAKLLIMRGKKDVRKLKGKQPKPTAWQIINMLA